ncbi:hypothetical protein [Streptomyces sp. NPDC004629]|uniref:hypothetical protein n=1 Tax=Streptomyces sp. NPDC004629 TaxID=3364705 RepID=UPI00367F5BD3
MNPSRFGVLFRPHGGHRLLTANAPAAANSDFGFAAIQDQHPYVPDLLDPHDGAAAGTGPRATGRVVSVAEPTAWTTRWLPSPGV